MNHRISEASIKRLLLINTCLGNPVEMDKLLLSKYLVQQNSVQVVMDLGSLTFSLTNTRYFERMMKLPELVYRSLKSDDSFGLSWLKASYGALLFNDYVNYEDIL